MRSHKNERFDKAFAQLPDHIKRQAREAYRLFVRDPYHPSLRFKQVHPTEPIYSARVTDDYRALGRREGEGVRLAPSLLPFVVSLVCVSGR